jgi:hypothetical protein
MFASTSEGSFHAVQDDEYEAKQPIYLDAKASDNPNMQRTSTSSTLALAADSHPIKCTDSYQSSALHL